MVCALKSIAFLIASKLALLLVLVYTKDFLIFRKASKDHLELSVLLYGLDSERKHT